MVFHLYRSYSRGHSQGTGFLILWNKRRDNKPCKILVTNRVTWEVTRILGAYRDRWTGTETFHRDGKQELGMGDCQLRDGQGQTRHMYLVMLAYTLLMRTPTDPCEGMGIPATDDDRRSLPRRAQRHAQDYDRMGRPTGGRKSQESTAYHGPFGLDLEECKSPVMIDSTLTDAPNAIALYAHPKSTQCLWCGHDWHVR